MKKIFVLIALMSLSVSAFCQSERTMNLYYFVHERSTPVSKLIERITDFFDTAAADEGRTVDSYLMLANGQESLVVKCREENRREYLSLLNELRNTRSHSVFPSDDIKRIMEIFSTDDYLNADGSMKYDRFNVEFYVGPDFWQNGYSENFISRLAFVMGWDRMSSRTFHMEIFRDEDDSYDYDSSVTSMFGTKKLIKPVQYILTY